MGGLASIESREIPSSQAIPLFEGYGVIEPSGDPSFINPRHQLLWRLWQDEAPNEPRERRTLGRLVATNDYGMISVAIHPQIPTRGALINLLNSNFGEALDRWQQVGAARIDPDVSSLRGFTRRYILQSLPPTRRGS